MKQKTIIQISIAVIFSIASLILGRNIYSSIAEKHEEMAKIKIADKLVIEKLQVIREAQKLYFEGNRKYSQDWDSLKLFIQQGEIAITQVKETVTTVNGKDSISRSIDTLSMAAAIDLYKENTGLNETSLATIEKVPLSGETFSLWANKMQGVQLVEVLDPKPINPRRQEDGDLKPLRIGSKAAATLKGNWE